MMDQSAKIRISPMSDLHIEFEDRRPDNGPDLSELKGNVDLVLLAGDVDVSDRAIKYGTKIHDDIGCEVVQIAGNHEFYGANRTRVLAEMRCAADVSPVNFLENDVAELDICGRRLRVLGATLWTDYEIFGSIEPAMFSAFTSMNDHRSIFETSRDVFLPEHALQLHLKSRAWLEAELAKPFDGETIVMTHHGPSKQSIPSRYESHELSAAYSSALDDLVESSGAVLWVHGHTHDSFDYMIGDTRVICNPRGYHARDMNSSFQPGLVIEL